MDMFSKYSLLPPMVEKSSSRSGWDVSCSVFSKFGMYYAAVGWASLAHPRASRLMGGGWKDEIWADLRAERRLKLQFQGIGAHPWLLERRRCLARGIYNRLIENDRFPNRQILSEVQWCLDTAISTWQFLAYQMAFGSNPAILFGGEDNDVYVTFRTVCTTVETSHASTGSGPRGGGE